MNNKDQIINRDINLIDLYESLMKAKFRILSFISLVAVISIIYALQIPNEYRAKITLVDADMESGDLSSTSSRLNSFAGVVGVNLDEQTGSKSKVALEIMTSWAFIESFIYSNKIEAKLVAVKGWNESTNKLNFNSEIYDFKNSEWIAEKPTSFNLYKNFSKRLKIRVDKKTSIITLSIDYYSPVIAKEWVELYVQEINQHMQDRQMTRTNLNIEYLTAEVNKTSIKEMKEVFYNLIAEQIKSQMIISASSQSTFVTVSKPMVPEEKSKPVRSKIVIIATLIAGFLALGITILFDLRRQLRSRTGINSS